MERGSPWGEWHFHGCFISATKMGPGVTSLNGEKGKMRAMGMGGVSP